MKKFILSMGVVALASIFVACRGTHTETETEGVDSALVVEQNDSITTDSLVAPVDTVVVDTIE